MSINLVLQPDGSDGVDTYIVNDSYSDLNLGSVDICNIGTTHFSKGTVYSRALVRFDVRAIPVGSSVSEAIFKMYHEASDSLALPAQFYARRLTQPSWTEFGATWNRYDGSNFWAAGGGDYTTADQDSAIMNFSGMDLIFTNFVNLVVDAITQRGGFLNLIVIGHESGSTNDFLVVRSSDHASAVSRPKLTVTYDPPPRVIPNFSGGMQQLTGNLGA